MTNKEAIEYLNDVRNGIHIPAPGIELPLLNDKEKEAVDMAISALENQSRIITVTDAEGGLLASISDKDIIEENGVHVIISEE